VALKLAVRAWLGISILALAENAPQTALHGLVTAKDGTPVASVVVYPSLLRECCPYQTERATTDDRGRFELPNPPRVLHFFKDGLAPASRVIVAGQSEISVVLEDDSATRWVLPVCPSHKEHGKRVGWPHQFLIPKGTHFQKHFRTDYVVSYSIVDRGETRALVIWTGPMVGGLDADDDWLVRAASLTERSVRDGSRFAGQDFRGLDKDGKHWRWTGLSGYSVARYWGVTDETEAFFDRIIDSACVVKDDPGE
jgi:hypothetical protein